MLVIYNADNMKSAPAKGKKRKPKKKMGPKMIKILPDSNWVISLLNPDDVHHAHVKACFGMLLPLKPTFYVATVVVMETMTTLIGKCGYTVKKARETIYKNFINKLDGHHKSEGPIELGEVLAKYGAFSKARKIKKLTTMDFYIVTEGLLLDARILTSDKKMYKTVKPTYKKIYLISDKVKNLKSDLPRLTHDVVNNLK
jgi:predicted nucleic acid-binding protein